MKAEVSSDHYHLHALFAAAERVLCDSGYLVAWILLAVVAALLVYSAGF